MSNALDPQAHHPSPHRRRTNLFSLLYSLVAPPAGWLASQVCNATLAQEACFPGTQPLAQPSFSGVRELEALFLVASLLISASAAIVAYRAWRRTRQEHGGDAHALIAIGEGRSRFMALAGMMTSLAFLAGALFSVPALIFVSAC